MNCWKFFFNSSDIGKMSSSPQWNHTLLNVDQATKQWATTGAAQVTLGRTKTVSWFVAINAFNKISYDFSWQLDIYIHPIHTTQLLLEWWTILLWSALYTIYHTLLSLLSFEIVIFLDCREMPAKKRRKEGRSHIFPWNWPTSASWCNPCQDPNTTHSTSTWSGYM